MILDDDTLIEIVARPEPLYEVRAASSSDLARIAWMLGPAEREPDDDGFAAVAQRTADAGEELIAEDDLAAAAVRTADAKLYIGNDGGMTHVAAATGTPTLAIYVATDPRVWRPLGEHVSVMDVRGEPESSRDRVLAQASSLIGRAQSE